MQTFLEATTWIRANDERLAAVDPSWHQGRGAYGGVVAAGILRALVDDVGDAARRPRSLTVHFCAPLSGRARLRTTIERTGSRVTHASARLVDDDGVVAIASASFGAPRGSMPSWRSARMPDAIPFAEASVVDPALMPAFMRNFECRFALGAPPWSGAANACVGAWLRPAAAASFGASLDPPLVAALLDALPPAALSLAQGPQGAASVDLTVHFYDDGPRAAADPLLVEATSRIVEDGYAEERAALWADGTLLGECRQIIAIL